MKKAETNTIKGLYCLIIVVLIVGCTNPTIIERNNTIYINRTINHTITINNTLIEPCNITCPMLEDCPSTGFNREYTLSLIRRVKFLEGNQDKFINHSDCFDELNKTKIELDRCKDDLCSNWNVSWC